jgi:hypothetical protein
MTPTPAHPDVYNEILSSTLVVTIKETGSNDFKLDMVSSAGEMTSGPGGPGGIEVPAGVDPSKGFGPVIAPGASAK